MNTLALEQPVAQADPKTQSNKTANPTANPTTEKTTPALSFDTLDLPEALVGALKKMAFNSPTPIQEKAIPHALAGKDILGSAQTGTGKTGAFGIPLAAKLINEPRSSALVLTPTRELAVQVLEALTKFISGRTDIKTALLIGGDSMPGQMKQIRARPRLVVGTPGRINDHLDRGNLMLHQTSYLVLDETDRMLDMGFSDQIQAILKFLPPKRQTLLFSATLPGNIVKLTEQYLVDPVRVSVGTQSAPAANLKQDLMHVSEGEKYGSLRDELDTREGSVIIFVKTKRGADKLAMQLRKDKHRAEAVHGDLHQSKRERVIMAFRKKKHRILVATDIAARGLDIPHIEHVINYDLPQCPEDYIHRIGRTARAGAEGSALCFITPGDKLKWRAIDRLLNPDKAKDNHRENGRGGAKKSNGGYKGNRNSRFRGKPGGNGGKPAGGGEGGFNSRRRKPEGNGGGARKEGSGYKGNKAS